MDFTGMNILITAGPTIEMWDDVRFLTNLSSGKTGYALARRSLEAGAETTLVSSVEGRLKKPGKVIKIQSALEMFNVVKKEFFLCDIFISAAAVCDFRPQRVKGKIKKRGNPPEHIKLIPNPDILKWASRNKGNRLITGFALQENFKEDIAIAKEKMKDKNCDIMVANTKENLGREKKTFILLSGETSSLHTDISLKETASVILKKCLKIKKSF